MADYYSVMASAVSRMSSKTDEARHAVYERARTAVLESLRTHDPPLSPAELATEQFALEAAIARVETELRRNATEEAMVPTKAEITERLAQDPALVQRTQPKAQSIERRVFALNLKGTLVLMGTGGGRFMWWWRKVRKANIPEELRVTFEQFGETVIATFLAMGITAKYTYTGPLGVLNETWQEALAWLAERRDIQERREDRRETVEWAILIWVVMGLIAEIILVMRL